MIQHYTGLCLESIQGWGFHNLMSTLFQYCTTVLIIFFPRNVKTENFKRKHLWPQYLLCHLLLFKTVLLHHFHNILSLDVSGAQN